MTRTLQNGFGFVTIGMALALSACAAAGTEPVAKAPTTEVLSAAETEAVASANVDAADDPAIWAAPEGSSVTIKGSRVPGFIAGTDKKAGLYIYDLAGRELQFLPDGLLNNVDLRGEIFVDGRPQVVLGASDRGRIGIALYLFDPASLETGNGVRPWSFVPSDVVEPYGFCMGTINGELHAVLIGKDGAVRQYRIEAASGHPFATEVRRFAVGSQSEGCVLDDRADALYIGEEAKGVWRYSADPTSGDARSLVQAVGATGRLVADVEGAALIRDGDATYLLVSSQGDSAFAVWRVDGAEPVYAGRFRITASANVDAVSGTDGIDALGGQVGRFPEGLVVVQDDENEGMAQNFKLVDWREIRRALNLKK